MAADTRAIAHNTIIQLVGKIISTVLGFAAIIMLGRYLTVEAYGWYTITISFLQFVAILIDFGLIPVSAQMLSEVDAPKRERIFHNLLAFRFVTAVVPLSIAPLISLWFFPYNQEIKIAIAVSAVSFVAIAMNQVLMGYMQTTMRMWRHVVADVTARASLVLFLFVLFSHQATFLPIMGGLVAANIISTLLLFLFVHRDVPIRFAFDFDEWRIIAKKMWPIAISIICNVVYLRGDTILLPLFASAHTVGLYGMAYRVVDILSQTAMLVMGIFLPLLSSAFARRATDQFTRYMQQAFDTTMLLAIPMTIGIMLLATPIMVLIKDEYAPAGGPLAMLALAVFGVYIGALFSHIAVAMNAQVKTIWIYALTAIVTVLGYLYAIPRYGMYGAAGMTVFSEIFAGVLLSFTVIRLTKHQLRYQTAGKILLSSAIMAGALIITPTWHVFARTALGIAVYALCLYITGVASAQVIREIIQNKKGAPPMLPPTI